MAETPPTAATDTSSDAPLRQAAGAPVTIHDLTCHELSMILLSKLTDAAHIWGSSHEELLDIAKENGILAISNADLREIRPLGSQSLNANAIVRRRAKAFEEQVAERYERARIARETTRYRTPKLVLMQIAIIFAVSLAYEWYGSLEAAKTAGALWLGWATPPPPPCPPLTWLQQIAPWMAESRPSHCND